MNVAQLNGAGQVTIPAAMRKKLGLAPGDQIGLTVEGDHLRLDAVVTLKRMTPEMFEDALQSVLVEYKDIIEEMGDR